MHHGCRPTDYLIHGGDEFATTLLERITLLGELSKGDQGVDHRQTTGLVAREDEAVAVDDEFFRRE